MKKLISLAVFTAFFFSYSFFSLNVLMAAPASVEVGDYVYSCGFDGFVNVRQEPSFSAAKVAKFYNGERARVINEQGTDWKQIEIGSTTGWVPVKYIQTAPTLAYTGRVDADWIEGIWGHNGTVLMVFNNGTYLSGYDYETSHGVYIMQNNEIRFIPTWTEEGLEGFDEILEIKEHDNMLGDFSRTNYLTQQEKDEEIGGFGCLTKADFKSTGKQLLAQVDKEKPFNVYALKESSAQVVQESTANDAPVSTESASESENTKKGIPHVIEYALYSLVLLAGIAVVVFLIILLVRLIKKAIASSKRRLSDIREKQALKAVDAESIDGQDEAGKTSKAKRKRIIWFAIAAVLLVVSFVLRQCADEYEDYGGGSSPSYQQNSKSDSYRNDAEESMDEIDLLRNEYNELQRKVMKLDRKILSTPDLIERQELIEEKEEAFREADIIKAELRRKNMFLP